MPYHYDQDALKAYFKDHIIPQTVRFQSPAKRRAKLVADDYLDGAVLDQYPAEFIDQLEARVRAHHFRFKKAFMGAYKFYAQYAMKTNDGKRFLRRTITTGWWPTPSTWPAATNS